MIRRLCCALFFISMSMIIGCGISGTVTDEEGVGIEKIEVKLKSSISAESTVTDSNGKYKFDFTMFGSYTVTAKLSNNLPEEYPNCVIAAKEATVSMETAATTVNFTLLDCYPGACCSVTGCADEVLKPTCEGEETGGIFQGGESMCSEIDCEAMGACCVDDTCTDNVLQSECETMSGTFTGGESCLDIECAP